MTHVRNIHLPPLGSKEIQWRKEEADFLGWDEAPHQATYEVPGSDGCGQHYTCLMTIVWYNLPGEEIISIADIEKRNLDKKE